MRRKGVIERYREFLPVEAGTPVVTLGEGSTPLVEVDPAIALLPTGCRFYVKLEGLNPTGSFKDRGMTVAVSKALENGAKAVICASTGNTSASAAAYAARAGLKAIVVLPDGAVAAGKLAQAMMHGARIVKILGNFDAALAAVRKAAEELPLALVNSVNPHRLEGQKTAAFEIVDELGDAPSFLALPVGNAGNITAYWKGFKEYHSAGHAAGLPRCLGFQAEGAAPIVDGHPVASPRTVATAIRIGNPASWEGAVAALTESGGLAEKVTDDEILTAYRLLAREAGIFCEPASAAPVAGLRRMAERDGALFRKGQTVVAILTGHGLKDPELAIKVGGASETGASSSGTAVPADDVVGAIQALL